MLIPIEFSPIMYSLCNQLVKNMGYNDVETLFVGAVHFAV